MRAPIEEIPLEMQVDGIETRGVAWGEQLMRHIDLPAGVDFTPLFKGLPGDMCQCPHWGIVLTGSISLRYADGSEEVTRAGEAYYWPGGPHRLDRRGRHVPRGEPGERAAAGARAPRRADVGADLSGATTIGPRRYGHGRGHRTAVPSWSRRTAASDGLTSAREALARHDWQACHDLAARSAARRPDRGGRAPRRARRGGVVARSPGRVHRCAASVPTAPSRSWAISRRAGSCAVWLYEHHCSAGPPRHRPRGGSDGRGARSRATRAASSTARCSCGRPSSPTATDGSTRRPTWPSGPWTSGETLGSAGPRGRGPADRRAGAHRRGRLDQGLGAPRRGHAVRRRGPPEPLLDRQGVLQPDRRLRGARRPAPGGRVDRGDGAVGATAPVRHLPGDLPDPSRGRARAGGARWSRPSGRRAGRATELLGSHLPNAAAAFAEVGDIRRRLGDLERAEEAFARAEELSGRPCAGTALLRLAQGRVEAAARIIAGCMAEQSPNRLARARLLPVAVQIAVAAGDLEGAEASVDELEAIAAAFDTPMLHAMAASRSGSASSSPATSPLRPARRSARRCAGGRTSRSLRGRDDQDRARPGAPRRRRRGGGPGVVRSGARRCSTRWGLASTRAASTTSARPARCRPA